jgi:alpha-mannosidase
VLDERGRVIPSQRLTTGELALLAEDVPAFGSRRYTIIPEPAGLPTLLDSGTTISNGSISLEVDPLRGTITSLTFGDIELVGDPAGGLNEYLYVPGRNPEGVAASGPAQVGMRERGPLVWSIETTAPAPGTNHGITSEIRLYDGIDRIDIINTIDKALVYDPEAVLYRFPFAISNPRVRIDVPWGSFQPDAEQLPGASKNYMSVERWVDIHNDRTGITFVTTDVPMIQLGEIRTDAIVTGWLGSLGPSATLYSYPMNNYWETNYRAGQEGFHEFTYSIVPHGAFDEAEVERVARGIGQPLIAVMVDPETPPVSLPFAIESDRAVVTLLKPANDGLGFVVRLYNPGDVSDDVRFRVRIPNVLRILESDVWERKLEELGGVVMLAPHEILTVVVTDVAEN